MARKVAVVAVAQTKYEKSKPALSIGELIWEVVEKVLQETGLKFEDQVPEEQRKGGLFIDKVVSCSEDYWQGRTISDCLYHLEMGALGMDETKVSADGALAVYHGVINIMSGKHEVVLVVAHRKESETIRSVIENAGLDPIYLRPLGCDFLTSAAMQAKRYMHKYGITEEQCAKVVVKNRGNAKHNPYAQEPLDLTVSDVLNSKMLAYPIKLLDAKPTSDGACALILASEEKSKRITNKPIWIKGMGNCYDAHYLGDRDLADCDSLVEAAKRAYKMAGIDNPRQEIKVAEISDEYSYQELLWLEGLGFCHRGEAGRLIDGGITEMRGELPVNPSGGILSGNPSGVAGMVRVAETVLQLRGEAGARQVADADVALAHGVTGPCGQSHCVIIMGK
jgi:acetyl-CoA C-acetyltransferase